MRPRNYKKIAIPCLASMGLALIIELFSLIVLRCAPFGGNSLAVVDASIQYLDFFAYLKDCLAGKNNIFYTFSKTLGGTNVAVFSYYLASPVNFLVVFFNKENFHTFFDLLVVIKLSFAAFSFSFFLKNRFQSLRNVFVISLGICYAFCQYNIAQACCIMWLDGVVMLPFILLGIHKFITEGKFLMLSLSVAFSMIFNWYTGAINCIFSAFFFVFEWGVRVAKYDKDFSLKKLKTGFFLGLKCASFMLAGVFLAAFLLIPTFTSLKNGRGHIDWNLFKNIYMYFDVPTILQGFLLAAKSSRNTVSLFCGSLSILGIFGIFAISNEKISPKEKIVFAAMTILVVLFFAWSPFFLIFSLLKDASSYWFRYSYVAIFFLLFSAGYFLEKADGENIKKLLKPILFWSFLIIMFQYLHPAGSFSKASNDLIMYISLAILFATFFLLFLSFRKEKSKIASVILLGICSCEMFFESVLTSYLYRYLSAKDFSKYVLDSEKLIDKIKNADSSAYRISQTSTNGFDFNTQITANYNESFGFNYKSIAGYTSDPDETQRMILERLGYNKMGDNMCIVNTSIIPADSLLGVKYVLSRWKIPEFVKREDLGSADGKAVYENPFAFPFAFKYTRENSSFLWADNPFEYTNQLYKTLANQNESVFVPIDSELTKNEQREKIWKIKSEMHPAVYAKVDCGHIDNTFMDVNGRYCQRYCSWLSPETIFVPTDFKDATVRISAPKDFSVSQTLFYACDFNVLRKAAETIRKNSASEITVKNGFCKFSIDGNEGEYLFTSIPCSEGWKIKLNGEIIKAEKFADSFISIPLRTGQNEIVMIYSVPGFFKGTIVSVLSLVFIVFAVRRRRVKKCSD